MVDGISLKVNKGEVLGIIGANGAGKSTTLETMMVYVDQMQALLRFLVWI